MENRLSGIDNLNRAVLNILTASEIAHIILESRQLQKYSHSEVRDLQNKRLRATIKHCYDHIRYYNRLFREAKLIPDDIKTVEDLKKIPITRKADIKSLPIEDITDNNANPEKYVIYRTSGSSGIPLTVFRDKKMWLKNGVAQYLFQLSHGEKISNKRVQMGGATTLFPPTFVQRLGILRVKAISPLGSTRAQLEEIKKYGARTLIGNPSTILSLAKEVKETDFKGMELSFFFTSGELLNENTRHFIEETFHGQLYDTYGAVEFGSIGKEYSRRCYHVTDTVFLETTKDGETLSAGEEGEITVTSLCNYSQPFVRYSLEDYGIIIDSECTCGSHFPLMKLTSGRVTDIIQLKNGRVISAHEANFFLTLMQQELKQYQVVQETNNLLTIKLVKGKGFNDNTITEIKQTYKKNLGDEIDVDVFVVDEIQKEKSGKFKLFKTNIPIT